MRGVNDVKSRWLEPGGDPFLVSTTPFHYLPGHGFDDDVPAAPTIPTIGRPNLAGRFGPPKGSAPGAPAPTDRRAVDPVHERQAPARPAHII